jgi:hypothetical protein
MGPRSRTSNCADRAYLPFSSDARGRSGHLNRAPSPNLGYGADTVKEWNELSPACKNSSNANIQKASQDCRHHREERVLPNSAHSLLPFRDMALSHCYSQRESHLPRVGTRFLDITDLRAVFRRAYGGASLHMPTLIEPGKSALFPPHIFLGHCFGLIPASGSFASSAFPVPP